MGRQGLLHLQRRGRARPRRGEHREERIPLRIDLDAAVRGQRRPDHRVMPGQHLRVDVVPQPPSSAVEPSMSVNKNVRVSTYTA
jgi:hypothetical protein